MIQYSKEGFNPKKPYMKRLFFILLFVIGFGVSMSTAEAGYVNGYYKSNGTYVNGYYRSDANGLLYDNYSYDGGSLYNSSYYDSSYSSDWRTPAWQTQDDYWTGYDYYNSYNDYDYYDYGY